MSYTCTRIHYIWSTAQRELTIDPAWRDDLHAYIAGILKNKKSTVLQIGGVEDHVHVYCSLPTTVTIADLANVMKANSTAYVREKFAASFAWQEGYAAFTMGKSADDDVCAYIRNQVEHHRTRSFKEELIAFLDKYQVPYDPKYVFA